MPERENDTNKLLRSLIDATFTKFDRDMTGEVELDELQDGLVSEVLLKYVDKTGHSIQRL